MAKRGRKSQADLATVTPIGPRLGRPHPPEDLTPDQAEEWRAVVAAMPGDWFGRESLAMLADYCRHACRARFLASRLDAMTLDDVGELASWDTLSRLAERETRAMLACARSLRLTHQARQDPKSAARRARGRPSAYELMSDG